MEQYKPFSSPTCICFKNVVDELQNDFDVFILANDYKEKNICDDQNVFRVKPHLISKLSNAGNHNLLVKILIVFEKIWKLLFFFRYPHQHYLYNKRLAKKGIFICKKFKINILIPVCFSIDNLYSAYCVKKKYKEIKLCPYIIDPFALGTIEKYLPKKGSRKKRIIFESKIFEQSSEIFLMKSSQKVVTETFPKYFSKMHFIDPPFFVPAQKYKHIDVESYFLKDSIHMSYTGYLYLPDRDPRILKTIFEMARKKMNNNIQLIIAGKSNCDKELNELCNSSVLSVKNCGFVSHELAISLMDKSDFLINFGANNHNAISGKIFEYIMMKKPIISIVSEGDPSLSYLNNYSLHFSIFIDKNDYMKQIDNLVHFVKKTNGQMATNEEIRSICADAEPRVILRYLK